MKERNLIWFIVLLTALQCNKRHESIYGCKLTSEDEHPGTAVIFTFKSSSYFYERMNIDSTNDTLPIGFIDSMVYIQDGANKINLQFVRLNKIKFDNKPLYVIESSDILLKSYLNRIKNFYISWPNGRTDSLYADFGQDNTKDNSCCCLHPLYAMQMNGKTYMSKLSDGPYGIWVFE